jgi:hypothetical protein
MELKVKTRINATDRSQLIIKKYVNEMQIYLIARQKQRRGLLCPLSLKTFRTLLI